MTISSMVLILGFSDLGMGLGLMNSISAAHGQDDRQAGRAYVSSGFFMLLGGAAVVLLIFSVAYRLVPWSSILNVKSALAVQEAGPAVAVMVLCFIVNLPLDVVQRVQLGYQEGFINSLWESLGRGLALGGLLLVIYWQGGLLWLVLAISGAPLLALAGNWLGLLGYQRPWLFPSWRYFNRDYALKLLRTGLFFFLLKLAVTLIYSVDNIMWPNSWGRKRSRSSPCPKGVWFGHRDHEHVPGAALAGLWRGLRPGRAGLG